MTFLERDSEFVFLGLFVVAVALLVWRRPRIGVPVALVATIAAAVVALGGDDGPSAAERATAQRIFAEKQDVRRAVAAAVRLRRLPRVALEMFPVHGQHGADIVPRPGGDGDERDVIRMGEDRETGRALSFDFDRDGRIEPEERNITERQLWSAALAGGRPGPERRKKEKENEEDRAPA